MVKLVNSYFFDGRLGHLSGVPDISKLKISRLEPSLGPSPTQPSHMQLFAVVTLKKWVLNLTLQVQPATIPKMCWFFLDDDKPYWYKNGAS